MRATLLFSGLFGIIIVVVLLAVLPENWPALSLGLTAGGSGMVASGTLAWLLTGQQDKNRK
jgi:hypothetical protein